MNFECNNQTYLLQYLLSQAFDSPHLLVFPILLSHQNFADLCFVICCYYLVTFVALSLNLIITSATLSKVSIV